MKLVLASNSPRRREILSQLGIDFEIIPSKFEEKPRQIAPNELAMHYAEGKAMELAKTIKEKALIIGADTIVYRDEIFGKPKDNEDAKIMLRNLSGLEHYVITGISVIETPSLVTKTEYETTCVKFKEISEKEIELYIKTGEPMGKAGAYAIQGLGSLFVEWIQGCYFNVVGLPIYHLSELLKSFEYEILKG